MQMDRYKVGRSGDCLLSKSKFLFNQGQGSGDAPGCTSTRTRTSTSTSTSTGLHLHCIESLTVLDVCSSRMFGPLASLRSLQTTQYALGGRVALTLPIFSGGHRRRDLGRGRTAHSGLG